MCYHIVERDPQQGFVVLKRRWPIERSFGSWPGAGYFAAARAATSAILVERIGRLT